MIVKPALDRWMTSLVEMFGHREVQAALDELAPQSEPPVLDGRENPWFTKPAEVQQKADVVPIRPRNGLTLAGAYVDEVQPAGEGP